MRSTGPVEDRLAIRELCDRYVAAVLSKDTGSFGELFALDAERTRLGRVVVGRDAIVAETAANLEKLSIAAIFCTPDLTVVHGLRATGRCFNSELIIFPEGASWMISCYDDKYAKLNGKWYFQKRSLTLISQDGITP